MKYKPYINNKKIKMNFASSKYVQSPLTYSLNSRKISSHFSAKSFNRHVVQGAVKENILIAR
jgi:hypothetical protein